MINKVTNYIVKQSFTVNLLNFAVLISNFLKISIATTYGTKWSWWRLLRRCPCSPCCVPKRSLFEPMTSLLMGWCHTPPTGICQQFWVARLYSKQECIPVGWVPIAYWLPGGGGLPGGVCLGGVCQRGLLGGVSAHGGVHHTHPYRDLRQTPLGSKAGPPSGTWGRHPPRPEADTPPVDRQTPVKT